MTESTVLYLSQRDSKQCIVDDSHRFTVYMYCTPVGGIDVHYVTHLLSISVGQKVGVGEEVVGEGDFTA